MGSKFENQYTIMHVSPLANASLFELVQGFCAAQSVRSF